MNFYPDEKLHIRLSSQWLMWQCCDISVKIKKWNMTLSENLKETDKNIILYYNDKNFNRDFWDIPY